MIIFRKIFDYFPALGIIDNKGGCKMYMMLDAECVTESVYKLEPAWNVEFADNPHGGGHK